MTPSEVKEQTDRLDAKVVQRERFEAIISDAGFSIAEIHIIETLEFELAKRS